MPTMTLQFHASPEEVVEFLNSSASCYELLEIVLYPRFSVCNLAWPIGLQKDDRFLLVVCSQKVNMQATSLQDFAAKNPNCLYVEVPGINGDVLSEGSIGFNADDEVISAQWRKLINQFKKNTKAGAIAVNMSTGSKAFVKSHRFTDAALQLQTKGIKMKPFAGNSLYLLGALPE